MVGRVGAEPAPVLTVPHSVLLEVPMQSYGLLVRCWRCGATVVFASVGAADADVGESALTTAVRAVVAMGTARRARVLEGRCVECVISCEADD